MSDAVTFAELNGQYVELLPTRTLLSLLSMTEPGVGGTPGIPGTPGVTVPIPGSQMTLPASLPGFSGAGGSAQGG